MNKPPKKRGQEPHIDFYQPFIGDIDNFIGVKNINNYYVSAIRDDPGQFGKQSVGVMQLYNKADGTEINKVDVARLEHIANLIGGLSKKCLSFNEAVQTIIGLIKTDVSKAGGVIKGLDSSPGMGIF